MPMHRQGTVGRKVLAFVTPLAAARAGTTNDAGGFVTNIDCRNYKRLTLRMLTGVLGTSSDCKLQNATASGGTYADVTGGATATGTAASCKEVDVDVDPARPWYSIVLVTVGSTTVTAAVLEGSGQPTDRP